MTVYFTYILPVHTLDSPVLCLGILLTKYRFVPLKIWILAILSLFITSCAPQNKVTPLTVVIGSWYGFYPLHFAAENGIDREHGLRLKVIEPTNVSNLRRAYLSEQADVAATSMVEFTNATSLTNKALKVLVITDYSNGGDVVIAQKHIKNIEQLNKSRIAVPSGGIGEFVLSLIFDTPMPTTKFKQQVMAETECAKAFEENAIDACVTYPPISTFLLRNSNLHQVYDSSMHPGRIFDLLWAKEHVSSLDAEKLRNTWFDTIALIERNPQAYIEFLSNITDVETKLVEKSMLGIQLVNRERFNQLIEKADSLSSDLINACKITKSKHCHQFGNSFSGF